MKATVETIRTIVKVLNITADEQQLLKDTIKHGYWGDASAEFVDEKLGDIIVADAEIYTTNDAKQGGHFSGRQVSTMFRSIYKKMCSAHGNQAGIHLSHCNDWWGNGTGDVLMLRSDEDSAWKEWAKEPVPPATKENPATCSFSIWRYDGKAGGYDTTWRGIGNSNSAKYFNSVEEAQAWLDKFGSKYGYGKRGVYWLIRESGTNFPPVPGLPQPKTIIALRIIRKSDVKCETPLGKVPVGSQVYSNYSQRTYQVVEHRRHHTSVLYLDGPYKDSFRQFDAAYPVVVKKLGDGKGPTKEELVARIKGISKDKNDTPSGFSVCFTEEADGVEMMVKRSANTNGFAATYTRAQLREIANAINAYLAK